MVFREVRKEILKIIQKDAAQRVVKYSKIRPKEDAIWPTGGEASLL